MQLLFWTHFCSFQFITWFKHSACNTIHSTFFNPALKYGHVVFQQQEQRNAGEVRKKRLGVQLSVEHSTASLLVGSHGITAWHPQACAAARERKREQSTSAVDSSATSSPSQLSLHQTPLVWVMPREHTPYPLPPALPCSCGTQQFQQPNLEKSVCWELEVSLTEICLENGYLWLWKSRSIKSLSLRENPASLIPQERVSLHRFFPQSRKCLCSLFPAIHCAGCGFSQAILWVWLVY